MIRVVLPHHLRTLARVDAEVTLDVEGAVTQRSVLAALGCGALLGRGGYCRRPGLNTLGKKKCRDPNRRDRGAGGLLNLAANGS